MPKTKKIKKRDPEIMLPMGIIFMVVGIVFLITLNNAVGAALLVLGAAYVVLSTVHKIPKKKK